MSRILKAPAFPHHSVGSTPLPEIRTVGGSGGAGGVLIRDGDQNPVRPPDPRPWRNEGKIGAIVTETMDLNAMRQMDPSDYLAPLDVIMDEKAFLAQLLKQTELPTVRKVSRHMQQHEIVMTDFGVFRRRRADEPPCPFSMALFTVL